jgi:hypothetical protein
MKKNNLSMEDDLRPEYDLNSLKVRKLGSGRKNFSGKTIHLDTTDVAKEVSIIAPFEITDEHKDVYQKCRDDLLKRQLSNTENFDRAILTLSSSTLGLTLTFIRNVTPIEEAHHVWLLLSAWILLAIAIVVTLSSFLISQEGVKKQMIYIEEFYLNGKDEYFNKQNIFSRLNDLAGYLSALKFTIAMFFLVAFVCLNITHRG